MTDKKIKSRYIFSMISILSIGILNLLSEASKQIKDFLTLNKGIGPYSGKVLFGILIGVIVAILYNKYAKESKFEIVKWTYVLIIVLVIACLLVFTPFIHLILGE